MGRSSGLVQWLVHWSGPVVGPVGAVRPSSRSSGVSVVGPVVSQSGQKPGFVRVVKNRVFLILVLAVFDISMRFGKGF